MQTEIQINAKDEYNQTPLEVTCANGNTDLVKQLFERRDVDVNCLSNRIAPLFTAYNCKHFKVVHQLLGNTYILMSKCLDSLNNTLLCYANKDKNFAVV